MIRRAIAAALLTATAMSAVPLSAHAAPTADRVIALGDSVMLGARWALQKQGVDIVDAKVSRQASLGPDLLRKRGSKLPANVVVHLGTNGDFPSSTCRRLVDVAGPNRHLYLLTLAVPRTWEKTNNARIRQCAAMHPDQVSIIDWHQAAKAHPTWLYADHIHLRPAGAKGYARLIAQATGASE